MDSSTDTSMTVADAAEALGVSERTVWRYLKSGKLAGTTVGAAGSQRTLVERASVDAISDGRGGDPQSAALRAERDQLAEALAEAESERRELRERVQHLQLVVARGSERRSSVPEAALTALFTGIERVRSRRAA